MYSVYNDTLIYHFSRRVDGGVRIRQDRLDQLMSCVVLGNEINKIWEKFMRNS